jgi:hypothetical protein
MIATVLTVAAYAVLLYRLNAYFEWYTTVRYPYWLIGRWMIPIISGTSFVLWVWSNSYVDHQRLRTPENSTDGWIIWVVLATMLIFVISLIYLIVYEVVTNWTAIVATFASDWAVIVSSFGAS